VDEFGGHFFSKLKNFSKKLKSDFWKILFTDKGKPRASASDLLFFFDQPNDLLLKPQPEHRADWLGYADGAQILFSSAISWNSQDDDKIKQDRDTTNPSFFYSQSDGGMNPSRLWYDQLSPKHKYQVRLAICLHPNAITKFSISKTEVFLQLNGEGTSKFFPQLKIYIDFFRDLNLKQNLKKKSAN